MFDKQIRQFYKGQIDSQHSTDKVYNEYDKVLAEREKTHKGKKKEETSSLGKNPTNLQNHMKTKNLQKQFLRTRTS